MALNACGLQAAESNRAILRYLAESTSCWGATPASGTVREMRITSSSLTAKKDTVVSNEVRSDRMIPDVVEVAASSGGDIKVEYSAGSLDDFLQAFLQGAWSRPMTFDKFEGSIVSIVDAGAATTILISGADYRNYFTVGRRIRTEGFANPANNDYWQIASMAYGSSVTTITTTVDTGISESGNAYGKVMDANDVIILKNTTIRAGTGAAKTFDSNGGNAFSSAISAGQLVVGQKLFVDFKPAYETGTFVFSGTKESGTYVLTDTPADGATLEITDGVVSKTFELDTDSAVTGSNTLVDITALATDAIGSALETAINASTLSVTAAYVAGTNTLTITNDLYTGGTLTNANDPGAKIAVVNFSGGVAGVLDEATCTINDGVNSVTFEFDDDDSFTRGNVQVTIGFTAALTAAALQAAIMDQLRKGNIECSASVSAATVTVRNLHPDQIANAATTALSDDTSAIASTTFSGAVAAFGVFTLTAVAADTLTVAEDVGTHANGGAKAVTIKGSHLRNPGDLDDITRQSFSIETGFEDVNQFFMVTGLRVGSFELSLSTGEIVNGSLSFEGKGSASANATVFDGDYTVLASTASPVMNATTNVGALYKNGEELSTAVQSLSIKGDASLRPQRAVSSKFPAGIGVGRFMLSGKITSYFETLEMYDHFLNHDTISIGFNFLDGDKNYYFWTIPALKITTDPIAPNGIDKDVLEEMEWVAIRDPNLNTQLMIDRFSSIRPATSL